MFLLQSLDGVAQPRAQRLLDFIVCSQATVGVNRKPLGIQWNVTAGNPLVTAVLRNEIHQTALAAGPWILLLAVVDAGRRVLEDKLRLHRALGECWYPPFSRKASSASNTVKSSRSSFAMGLSLS